MISIHPPRVGRDQRLVWYQGDVEHFNPPAPGGAGPGPLASGAAGGPFQSTRPGWGGTRRPGQGGGNRPISIHPPRVGRDSQHWPGSRPGCISIHPPRVGRDLLDEGARLGRTISIHPPRVGRDLQHKDIFDREGDFNPPAPGGAGPKPYCDLVYCGLFQSTRPGWGGTPLSFCASNFDIFQSTRPGWGGT